MHLNLNWDIVNIPIPNPLSEAKKNMKSPDSINNTQSTLHIHLSSVWFFLSCIREKLECQAKFPGYQSNGRIASVSPPSATYK